MYIYTCSSLRDRKLGESLSRHISRFNHSVSHVHISKYTRRWKTVPTVYASCNTKTELSTHAMLVATGLLTRTSTLSDDEIQIVLVVVE